MRETLAIGLARGAAYGAGRVIDRACGRWGWSPAALDPDRLEAAARRAARLDNFGDPYYRTGLERLIASLERDADLHLIGRLYLRQILKASLVNRLMLQEHRRARPDIFEAPLRPPLVITGLPRSGSTMLHRMMARIPGLFAPPYWMLVSPVPRSPADTDEARMLRARRDLLWWKAVTPSVRAKHKLKATLAEECVFALGITFETAHQGMVAPADGYLAWYATTDRRKKYLDYRAILLALQAQRPGRTLLLKAPDHLGGLDALLAAVPEAMVVQLHRDPVAVVNSYTSLIHSVQLGVTDRNDPARVALSVAGYLESELRRNLAQRKSLDRSVLDIRYDELTADPAATASSVLKTFEIEAGPSARRQMTKYLASQPKGKWGGHEYRGADYGLDDRATAARFRFYTDAFGLGP